MPLGLDVAQINKDTVVGSEVELSLTVFFGDPDIFVYKSGGGDCMTTPWCEGLRGRRALRAGRPDSRAASAELAAIRPHLAGSTSRLAGRAITLRIRPGTVT